jgi:hypothetical protein
MREASCPRSLRSTATTGIRQAGALALLVLGAVLVLWMLGAAGDTRENCERGDLGACAELRIDYGDPYR